MIGIYWIRKRKRGRSRKSQEGMRKEGNRNTSQLTTENGGIKVDKEYYG